MEFGLKEENVFRWKTISTVSILVLMEFGLKGFLRERDRKS